MGCGGSTPVEAKTIQQIKEWKLKRNEQDILQETYEEEVKYINHFKVTYELPEYPMVRPPNFRFKKPDFTEIDLHAKQTPTTKTASFDELTTYLIQNAKNDAHKVRALFVWMGTQNIRNTNFAGPTANDPKTPDGFMKLVKSQQVTYASFFTLLCRSANIPCVMIKGVAKSVCYDVGMEIDDVKMLRNCWNAVYVDGSWRLVFPLWAFTYVKGFSLGELAPTKAKVSDKDATEKQTKSNIQYQRSDINIDDYYFFTNPEEFINIAFPDDPKWQLMNKRYSLAEFVDMPQCTPLYHALNMKIRSRFSGTLFTTDGTCTAEVEVPEKAGFRLRSELYYNPEESGQDLPNSLELDNYVFVKRNKSFWKFGIRLPEAGVYELQILGHYVDHHTKYAICAFKIICEHAYEHCQPLPLTPALGYGPSSDTEKSGLRAISHYDGFVNIQLHKEVRFTFTITEDILLKSELVSRAFSKEVLQQNVSQTILEDRVKFTVSVPDKEQEYALQVFTKRVNTTEEFRNACNYLLGYDDPTSRKRKGRREDPRERKARSHLQDVLAKGSLDELEEAIGVFHKLKMTDKGDLTKAKEEIELKLIQKDLREAIEQKHVGVLYKTVEKAKIPKFKESEEVQKLVGIAEGTIYYIILTDLRNSIKRRNRGVLTRAIGQAKHSPYASQVSDLIAQAEELRDHLIQLDKFTHPVLAMDGTTLAELKSYKKPLPVIYDVMFATFLMLGVNKEDIWDWQTMQTLITLITSGEFPSMVARIRNFDTIHVTDETVREVEHLLEHHTEDETRIASAGAGTFYVWLTNILGAIHDQRKKRQEEEEAAARAALAEAQGKTKRRR